jgi:hypothetical protein
MTAHTPDGGGLTEAEEGVLGELAEAVANAVSDRPQRCGHSADPMCCPYENFPTLAAFFDPDRGVFCEHGHDGRDPEPCAECWTDVCPAGHGRPRWEDGTPCCTTHAAVLAKRRATHADLRETVAAALDEIHDLVKEGRDT